MSQEQLDLKIKEANYVRKGTPASFKKGSVPWNTGKSGYKMSQPSKLKGVLNGGPSKCILQYDKDTFELIKEYPSASEATRQLGQWGMKAVAAHPERGCTCGGFLWVYKDNKEEIQRLEQLRDGIKSTD